MSDVAFNQLIGQAEELREQEDYVKAACTFNRAMLLAAEKREADNLVSAICHNLLIHKYLYENSKNPLFLEMMHAEANKALDIAEKFGAPSGSKAMALLRIGDFHFELKQYEKAEEHYGEALALLNGDDGEYPHYLSVLGLSQVLAGKKDEGMKKIEDALKKAEGDSSLRPFHKLIVLSGIMMRKGHALASQEKIALANEVFMKTEELCKMLASEFGMPVRLKQLSRLKSRLNL
jgi:tetratricopeptide (TPR) repeat protein